MQEAEALLDLSQEVIGPLRYVEFSVLPWTTVYGSVVLGVCTISLFHSPVYNFSFELDNQKFFYKFNCVGADHVDFGQKRWE